jgi:hypothetical protein
MDADLPSARMLETAGAAPLFTRSGNTYIPSEGTRGPWSDDAQHAGPVAGLIAALIEEHEPERDLAVVRITYELLRPLPLRPLRVELGSEFAGRSADRVVARVLDGADDKLLAVARALRLRRRDFETPRTAETPVTSPADCPPVDLIGFDRVGFVTHGVELRLLSGNPFRAPGPAAVWFRLRQPVLAGRRLSGLQRICATADFGNGISNVVGFDAALFINADLTVAVHRDPIGEWLCLDSVTHANDRGSGLTTSRLLDPDGQVGVALQNLLIAPRT